MFEGHLSQWRAAAAGVICGCVSALLLYGGVAPATMTAMGVAPGMAPLAAALRHSSVDTRATAVHQYQALSGRYTVGVESINARYPATFGSDAQRRAYYMEMAALESAWVSGFSAISFPQDMQPDVHLMVTTEQRVVTLLAAASSSATPEELALDISHAYDDTSLAANAIRADLSLPLIADTGSSSVV